MDEELLQYYTNDDGMYSADNGDEFENDIFDDTDEVAEDIPTDLEDKINNTTLVPDGYTPGASSDVGTPGSSIPQVDPPADLIVVPDPQYKTETITEVINITEYDPEYLLELQDNGFKFYANYTDGTKEEVLYSDVYDPIEANASSIVFTADAIGAASNQHFWNDSNGVHVSDNPKEDWEQNEVYLYDAVDNPIADDLDTYYELSGTAYIKTADQAINSNKTYYTQRHTLSNLDNTNYHNILMNSLGILLRKAYINFAMFSRANVAFFDGAGNNEENILAFFGALSAQIGRSNSNHVVITSNGVTAYKGDGTLDELTAIVDGVNIKNSTITGSKIASSTIENSNIKDGTITGAKIQGSTLTNIPYAEIDQLKTRNVTADAIQAATGFVSSLATNSITAAKLVADQGIIDNLETNFAHIQNGVIDNANINVANVNGLSANYAHITNGVIDNAKIGHADVNGLSANYASVGALSAETARIDTLVADTADLATIRANAAKVTNLTATQLEADHATVGSLDTNYAQIDMANVNNTWIQNGTIKDAAISDGMINSVSANKLTAGTIDASNITVTNLNADNITAGTINGQRIGTGSLSLDKLEDDVYTETEVDNIVSNLQTQIDGAIETWTGTTIPTLQNAPASSWTTNSIKDTHVGDVYFVVNSQSNQNGYNYRFTKSGTGNNVTYSWQLIKDSDVTNALARLTTAEGKIGTIETFDSEISSWKTNTDQEISSIKSAATTLAGRVTTAEGQISTKVDSTTFNTLSQTVDSNSSSIQQLTTETTTITEKITLEKPYKEVEWVESDGHQFVYTHWYATEQSGFDIDFQLMDSCATGYSKARGTISPVFVNVEGTSYTGTLFGNFQRGSTRVFGLSTNGASGRQGWISCDATNKTSANGSIGFYTDGRRQQATLRNRVYTAPDGTIKTLSNSAAFTTPAYVTIFCALESGTAFNSPIAMRLYSLKFYDGDTLAVDLVGAVRKSDGNVGLYDKIENHFYPSQGLTCGNFTGVELGKIYTVTEQLAMSNPVLDDTRSADSRALTINCPLFEDIPDGQRITVSTKRATAIQATTYHGAEASGNTVLLDATIKDNRHANWAPVYYGGTTVMTTQYGAGTILNLVYKENVFIGTAPVGRGWWADANYDTDTNTNTVTDKIANSVVAGKNGINHYSLVMKDDEGNWTSLTTTAGTATTKVAYVGPLQYSNVAYSSPNGRYEPGTNSGDGVYNSLAVDIRYSTNVANNATSGLTARQPVYLVGEVHSDGYFYLDTPWWTQTVPTTEDGKTYIYLGIPYSYYQIWLAGDNTVYRFMDGEFTPVYIHTIERSVSRINEVTDTVSEHTRKLGTLETTVENKADSSTVTTVSNNLNTLSQTVNGQAQTISSLQSTVENKADGSTVTSLTSRVNDISDTVDGHTSTLQSTTSSLTTLRTDFDNLEVGGRNYAKTNDPIGTVRTSNGATVTVIGPSEFKISGTPTANFSTNSKVLCGLMLEPGTYCIWLTNTYNGKLMLRLGKGESNTHVFSSEGDFTKSNPYILTVTEADIYWLGPVGLGSTTYNDVTTKFMIERGTKATDWSPAPEDVDAAIAAVPRMSKINTAQRTFTSDQWKTYGAYGHLEHWVTGSSYDNSHLRIGDRAYLTGTISDQMHGSATIIGKVTSVVPAGSGTSGVWMQSEQLIFGGDAVSAIQTSLSETQTDYATFKQTTQNFESTIGSTYATKEELTTTVEQATQQYVDVEAEPFIIDDDGINAPLRSLEANGWSEQFSTTGKNLLPREAISSSVVSGVTFKENLDGSFTANGTATANIGFAIGYTSPSDSISEGTYTLSGCPAGGSQSTYSLRYFNNNTNISTYDYGNGGIRTLTSDQASKWNSCWVYIMSGVTCNNLTFYPQLELGSTATSYEPYTGGAPSPSPDYPQEIKVAKGRNLLDASTIRIGISHDGAANQYRASIVRAISVGSTYTFSIDGFAYECALFFKDQNGNSVGNNIPTTELNKSFTVPSGATTIVVLLNKAKTATGTSIDSPAPFTESDMLGVNVQLEIGSTPTPYVPYGHVGLEVEGRNLLDTSQLVMGSVDSNGNLTTTTTNYARTPKISVKPNTVYIAHTTYATNAQLLFAEWDGNGTYLGLSSYSKTGSTTSAQFTTKPTTTQVVVIFRHVNTPTVLADFAESQLELGSTATEYEPYYHTTTPIPLPERGWAGSLRDGTSDVLTLDWTGRWEWENKTEMPTFDENANVGTNGSLYWISRNDISTPADPRYGLCNYLVYGMDVPGTFWNATTLIRLNNGDEVKTVENFRSWLSTHHLTFLFPLATPTTESGYADMPDVYPGCTVSIPELDEVGISYWTPASKSLVDNTRLLEERVSNAETSIDQNKDQIALRAKSSDVYTKTQTDGLISTEVSNRNAAIQLSAEGINTEVSKKTDKATIISTIRQSAETVKIKASQVEIDGAAIFSNSDFRTAADAAYDTKGSAAAVQTNLDNLEIGGTNLLPYTVVSSANLSKISYQTTIPISTQDGYSCYEIAGGSTVGNFYATKCVVTLEANTIYTYSAWVKVTTTNSVTSVPHNFTSLGHFSVINSASTASDTTHEDIVSERKYSPSTVPVNAWTHIEMQFKTNSLDGSKFGKYVKHALDSSYTVYVRNMKLEKGNKATDWTPAPEDYDSTVLETHRIYYRTGTVASLTGPVTWVTEATGNVYNQWTTKVPPLSADTGGQTKYPYLYTCEQRRLHDGTIVCTTVQRDDNSTIIDGGQIITNSITATKIAANAITATKLNIGDTNNYACLDPYTASEYGFTYDDTADGRWYTMTTLKRDTIISPMYDCKGGEKFRVSFEVSSSVQGRPLLTSTEDTYLPVTVGFVCSRDTGSPFTWPVATMTDSSANAPATVVSSEVTFLSEVKRFQVFIQIAGFQSVSPMSGTFKIRNIKVYKMTTGELIVDGAISADKIAGNSLTIGKFTNEVATKINNGDAAKTQIDNLEIGGRNLYVTVDSVAGYINGSNGSISSAGSVTKERASDYIPVTPGESMVFQVWVTPATGSNHYLWMGYAFYDSNKAYLNARPSKTKGANTGTPQYDYYGFTVPENAAYIRVSARMYDDGLIKLERGIKPTDWSPAPEDVDNKIDDASKTATNYIRADTTGIRIANDDPSSATTYQHLTATDTDFVVEGDSKLKISGGTVIIGSSNNAHIEQSSTGTSFYAYHENVLKNIININVDTSNAGYISFFEGSSKIAAMPGFLDIGSYIYPDENTGETDNNALDIHCNSHFDDYTENISMYGYILNDNSSFIRLDCELRDKNNDYSEVARAFVQPEISIDPATNEFKGLLFLDASNVVNLRAPKSVIYTDSISLCNTNGTNNASIWRNAIFGVSNGVVPATLGGTGYTSLQATRNAMGLGNTTGALPIANGGTGQTGTTNSNITLASGTSGSTYNVRKWGNVVTLFLYNVKFTAAVADDGSHDIGTIPTGYRPANGCFAQVATSNLSGPGYISVTSAGAVSFTNRSGAQLAANKLFSATITYVIG